MLGSTGEINSALGDMPVTWSSIWTKICNSVLFAARPVLDIISFLAQNWEAIKPIVIGAAIALGFYTGLLLLCKAQTMATGIATAFHAMMTEKTSFATIMAAESQSEFNKSLLTCPLVWIVGAIIAVIAVIYGVIAVINKVNGSSLSATGMICGAFMWLGATLLNSAIGVINAIIQFMWTRFVEPIIGIIEWVLNVFGGGFDSFGDGIANLIGNIISMFLSFGKMATHIIDAVFGTDWTSGLESMQDSVLAWGKNENAITLERDAPTFDYRFDATDAFDSGNAFGEGIDEKLSMFGGELEIDSDVRAGVDATAQNTGDMSDEMNTDPSDLEYMRELASMNAINRFTTNPVSVNMGGMTNNLSSNVDVDNIIGQFAGHLGDCLCVACEGVHN